MDTDSRIEFLQPPDGEVVALLGVARRRARAGVSVEWASVDLRDRAAFTARKDASDRAVGKAERDVWLALVSGDVPGRCPHGASSSHCLIRGCSDQQPQAIRPSYDRYAPGPLRRQVLERDGYRCVYCHRGVRDDPSLPQDDPAKANFDHVIPWPEARTRLDNVVTACSQCNREKGTREAIRDDQGQVVGWARDAEVEL
jgi:5-methylcytosine-specific restriction endonuclease McrA